MFILICILLTIMSIGCRIMSTTLKVSAKASSTLGKGQRFRAMQIKSKGKRLTSMSGGLALGSLGVASNVAGTTFKWLGVVIRIIRGYVFTLGCAVLLLDLLVFFIIVLVGYFASTFPFI